MDSTSVTPEKVVETIQLDGTFDSWKQKAEQELTSSEKYKEIKTKMKKLLEKSSVLKQRSSYGSNDRTQIFEQLKQEIYKSDVMKDMQQEIHNVLYGDSEVAKDIKEGTLLCVKRFSGEEENEKFKEKQAQLEQTDHSKETESISTSEINESNDISTEQKSPSQKAETPTSSTVLTIEHTQSAMNMSSNANFLEDVPSPSPNSSSSNIQSKQSSDDFNSISSSKEKQDTEMIRADEISSESNQKKRPRKDSEEETKENQDEQPASKKMRTNENSAVPTSSESSNTQSQSEQHTEEENKTNQEQENLNNENKDKTESKEKDRISLSDLFDKKIIKEGNQILLTCGDITHTAIINSHGKIKYGENEDTYSEFQELIDSVFKDSDSYSPKIKIKQGENTLSIEDIYKQV
eukprot:gb/GECH01007816.1/.p1 GENE.gb/GECH01007816.1/~~gb/GECH01007816.1/.p1  ORF type:complete len:406 (+),score=137.67 gb/GECH01007816.1/:1-1218(+)